VVQADVFVPFDHPAFPGHFPGQPLLPGVSLLAEVMEAVLRRPELAAQVGPSPRLGAAKFLSPVRPGTALTLHFVSGGNGLRFEVKAGERPVASGHFERIA
jgi:3-hydroxyacyl-[acyl-carrier-protein] dehydratase